MHHLPHFTARQRAVKARPACQMEQCHYKSRLYCEEDLCKPLQRVNSLLILARCCLSLPTFALIPGRAVYCRRGDRCETPLHTHPSDRQTHACTFSLPLIPKASTCSVTGSVLSDTQSSLRGMQSSLCQSSIRPRTLGVPGKRWVAGRGWCSFGKCAPILLPLVPYASLIIGVLCSRLGKPGVFDRSSILRTHGLHLATQPLFACI